MPFAVDPWADPVPVRRPGDFARHPETGAPYVSDPTRMVDAKYKLAELIELCAKLGIAVPDKPRVAQLKALLGDHAMRMTMVQYGRPSSLGKQIENMTNIQKWSERATALGIFLVPAVLEALAALDPDQLNLDDAETRKLLDGIAVEAKNIAQAGLAAERGTHIHERTEDFDTERDWIEAAQRGEELGLPTEVQRALVAAWEKMLHEYGFEVLAVETACVDDLWRQAGTLDRIVRMTREIRFVTVNGEFVVIPAGTVLILDIKTGRLRLDDKGFVSYWHGYSVQLASYAQSLPYDVETDTRREWDFDIDQQWAIIAHLDVLTALNEGVAKCRLVLVDLEAGRYAGELCVAARAWEKRTDVFSIPTDDLTVSVPVSPAGLSSAADPAGEPIISINGLGSFDTGPNMGPNWVSSSGSFQISPNWTSTTIRLNDNVAATTTTFLPAQPVASVVDTPTTEEPPTPQEVAEEAAPAADVDPAAGAENFAEHRGRLLERHKALTPELKRKFREARLHPADLDHIEALLDELENPPNVRELVQERMAVDEAAEAARPQDFPSRTPVRFTGDEGAEVDKRAADDLMAMGHALSEDRQRPIHAVATEAHDSVGGFSLKGRLSMRRFDITRALITWARIDWNDDLIRACLVAATGDEAIHQPAIPLGVAIGMLDAAEASVFADITARLAAGSMVPDYSGLSPRFVAA